MSRPAVPAALKRQLYEESGYRCAVPTCRSTSILEMAHIEPRADVQEDTFDNMIVLCSMCHGLYDREKKIPRKSIEAFKANLAVVNGRYSDYERRVLEYFADNGNAPSTGLMLTFHQEFHLRNLIRDGLLELTHRERHVMSGHFEDGIEIYALTSAGRGFVERWVAAATLD